jgi:putative ABC transport system substrate-binding protein
MKRIFVVLLIAGCLIGGFQLADPVYAESTQKKIVVMWVGKSGMSQRMYLAMRSHLRETAPQIQVDWRGELSDLDQGSRLFERFQKEYDAVVWFRGSGAKFLSTVQPSIPVFVGACNNPKILGAVKNLEAPEGMITGVTYYIPYSARFQFIRQLFPNIKRVALVAEQGHPSAPIDIEGTQRESAKYGIECLVVQGATSEDLLRQVENVAPKIDLLILAENRLVQDLTVAFLAITNRNKTPIFSYSEKPTKSGAVAGFVSRDNKRAEMLAESIVDVLIKGRPIRDVPVKMDEARLVVNVAMAKLFEVKVSANLASRVTYTKD